MLRKLLDGENMMEVHVGKLEEWRDANHPLRSGLFEVQNIPTLIRTKEGSITVKIGKELL